jgi:hypothetical protein
MSGAMLWHVCYTYNELQACDDLSLSVYQPQHRNRGPRCLVVDRLHTDNKAPPQVCGSSKMCSLFEGKIVI